MRGAHTISHKWHDNSFPAMHSCTETQPESDNKAEGACNASRTPMRIQVDGAAAGATTPQPATTTKRNDKHPRTQHPPCMNPSFAHEQIHDAADLHMQTSAQHKAATKCPTSSQPQSSSQARIRDAVHVFNLVPRCELPPPPWSPHPTYREGCSCSASVAGTTSSTS